MANTSSAKKAQRASEKRRVFNLRRKKAVKAALKGVEDAIAAKKAKDAAAALPALYKAVDKAVKTGVLQKNTASRMKSRLSKGIAVIAK